MRTIYKYTMDAPNSTFDVPMGGQVRDVHMQDGWPNIWIDVDTEYRLVRRTFQAFATGASLPSWSESTYLGTVHIREDDENTVWHILEIHEKSA